MADKRLKRARTEEETIRRREFMTAIPSASQELGDMVRSLRKFSRLTQAEFASRIGIAVNILKEIERGRGNPTIETMNKIGKPFGLQVSLVRMEPRTGSAHAGG
jgi:DNA-binding XRE family transcriptional regulator